MQAKMYAGSEDDGSLKNAQALPRKVVGGAAFGGLSACRRRRAAVLTISFIELSDSITEELLLFASSHAFRRLTVL